MSFGWVEKSIAGLGIFHSFLYEVDVLTKGVVPTNTMCTQINSTICTVLPAQDRFLTSNYKRRFTVLVVFYHFKQIFFLKLSPL